MPICGLCGSAAPFRLAVSARRVMTRRADWPGRDPKGSLRHRGNAFVWARNPSQKGTNQALKHLVLRPRVSPPRQFVSLPARGVVPAACTPQRRPPEILAPSFLSTRAPAPAAPNKHGPCALRPIRDTRTGRTSRPATRPLARPQALYAMDQRSPARDGDVGICLSAARYAAAFAIDNKDKHAQA